MIDILHREFIYFWFYFSVQFQQIFKYWALGVIIGSFMSVFLKSKINHLLEKLSGKRLGILGLLPASFLGVASPLCMYGTVPIVASFYRSGMRQDFIAAFMMSSILLNPQLFFYSFALGTNMALLRLCVAILGGILAGLLVLIFFRKESFYQFDEFAMPANHDTDKNPILRLIKNIWRNVKITFPYFLLGIILTALYQRYIPNEWIIDLFGSNKGFGALMAAALGVPLYTCGGGTIPLISAWLDAGMSKGSAIAFIITGPATKITNLGAVKIVLGFRNFIIYIIYSVLFAVLCGILVDILF